MSKTTLSWDSSGKSSPSHPRNHTTTGKIGRCSAVLSDKPFLPRQALPCACPQAHPKQSNSCFYLLVLNSAYVLCLKYVFFTSYNHPEGDFSHFSEEIKVERLSHLLKVIHVTRRVIQTQVGPISKYESNSLDPERIGITTEKVTKTCQKLTTYQLLKSLKAR